MRSTAAGCVGIAMVLGGAILCTGLKYWVDTRDFNPVHVPIKLEKGSTIEREFSVNTGGQYCAWISIPLHEWNIEDSEDKDHQYFRWEIRDSSGADVPTYAASFFTQADGTVRGMTPIYGRLHRGRYTVKLVVVTGSQRLSKYQPSLNIETDRDDYDSLVILSRWIAMFAITGGLMLCLRRALFGREEKAAEEQAFAAPPTGGYATGAITRRVREGERLARFPHWGTYGALTTFVVLVPVWVFFSAIGPLPARGLWVRLLRDTAPKTTAESSMPKVLVQVLCGRRTGYMLHGQLVNPKDLEDRLKHELARQPDWTVYVEGDLECTVANVVHAADVAHGLQARVVLVTPASRHLVEGDIKEPITHRPAVPSALRLSAETGKR